jgi:hypothetical protein
VAVQVWIGEKPEHSNERRAIVALANGLERLDGLYLILANFSVGGRNIDLVVVKQDAIFIVELKHCDGKVFGDVNGPWFVEGGNGERKRLNPGRKNPYNQVISYYYSLINFLNDRRVEFLSSQKATSVDFRTCRRLVVIAPTIQEGSKIETDWKVELKGLDELPAYLITERSSEIDLSDEEMLAIPRLLHLTHWSEINALLAGVLPRLEEVRESPPSTPPAPPPAEPAAPVAVAPAVASPPDAAPAAPEGLWSRGETAARRVLSTWSGRASIVLGALVLVLALALLNRPAPPPPIADQPIAPILVSTSEAAGGADARGILPAESCVWSGFQAVGRRPGAAPDSWENVGVGGAAPALAPAVVVTLEEVSFCDGRIALSWSLRNNMDDSEVTLPLTAENISVRDSLGNEYIIDEQPRPAEITAAPRNRSQGRVVIERSVNPSSPTLVVQLKQQPFGEATWLVPISTTK